MISLRRLTGIAIGLACLAWLAIFWTWAIGAVMAAGRALLGAA